MKVTRIIDDLLSNVNAGATVTDIRVGPYWTAVLSRNCGLAATPRAPDHHHRSDVPGPVKEAGRLIGKDAFELAQLARSDNDVEAAIGIAAVNSLIEIDERRCIDLNAADLIEQEGRGKRVAVVGHFPFVERLRKTVKELWVLERNPAEGDVAESDMGDIIPEADLVAITGSTFVNRTIEAVLELCSPEAQVIVLGPSTPLSPVLFDYGVSVVSGTRVVDPDTVLQHVSQGATFRQMKGVRLLTMKR